MKDLVIYAVTGLIEGLRVILDDLYFREFRKNIPSNVSWVCKSFAVINHSSATCSCLMVVESSNDHVDYCVFVPPPYQRRGVGSVRLFPNDDVFNLKWFSDAHRLSVLHCANKASEGAGIYAWYLGHRLAFKQVGLALQYSRFCRPARI